MTNMRVCQGALILDSVHAPLVILQISMSVPDLSCCLAVQAVIQFQFDYFRQRISCRYWTVHLDSAWYH